MKINTKNKPKFITIIATVLLLAAFAGLAYVNSNQNVDDKSKNTENEFSPPTDDEKMAGDQQKEKLPDQAEQRNQPNDSKGVKKVTPIITSSGYDGSQLRIASRVPGVLENGGDCRLVLTKEGKEVSASKKGVANVSEVSCGVIVVGKDKLSKGIWEAQMFYSSPKASGQSNIVKIEVN